MPPAATLRVYYLLVFGALGLYLPFFPSWLIARGFRGAQMSALLAVVPLLGFFSPPLVGMLSDGLGMRRRVIALTALCTALGLTTLAVASASLSPLPFAVAAGSMSVFAAFRSSMVSLADAVTLESSANYGRVRLFGTLGFLAAASLLGPLVDIEHPYQLPAWIAGFLWASVLVSLGLPRVAIRSRSALEDARSLLSQGSFRWLLLSVSLCFLSHSAYDLCASLRLRDLGAGPGAIGAFWSIGTFAEIFIMYSGHKLTRRLGAAQALRLALVVAAVRWLLLSQVESAAVALLLQPLHAITFGLMWLSLIATLRQEVGDRGLATGQGLLATGSAIGNTLGMWAWGLSYERWGSRRVFLFASCVALVGALVAWRQSRIAAPSASRVAPGT